MLVTLKEILEIAEEKKIAVGAFNTPNLESLIAILDAAEELQLPVIIQFAECHEHLTSVSITGPLMVEHAKKATVPVCVHLDHGETLECVQKVLDMGFTGVMFDGSTLPYEDCCTIFVAKHPVTKPLLHIIEKSELELAEGIDELMQKAIESVEVLRIE